MTLPALPSAQLPWDDLIVQGQDHVLRCPLHRDGELVVPDAGGTVSVRDAARVAVVDDAAVQIVDGVATYTVPGATTAALTRGEGWSVEWSLAEGGRALPRVRNAAALVRTHLYPVVTDEMLWRRSPALNPRMPGPVTTRPSYQPQIDEAWADILGRLAAKGVRPHLVTAPSALREVHLLAALALIYEDFDGGVGGDRFAEVAQRYREQYERAWERVAIPEDADDDGRADAKRRMGGWWACGR